MFDSQKFLSQYLPKDLNPYLHREDFLSAARAAAFALPQPLKDVVGALKSHKNQDGYAVIEDIFYLDTLPDTPTSAIAEGKTEFSSEFWLACVSSLLGEQVGYSSLNDGAIFHNVLPIKAQEQAISSRGSKKDLSLHSDLAFHPDPPNYLLLYCLKTGGGRDSPLSLSGARSAPTYVSSLSTALAKMECNGIDILLGQNYKMTIDRSFSEQDEDIQYNTAVLFEANETLTLRVDFDLLVATTKIAATTLQHFREVLNEVKIPVYLNSGQILIIDNNRALHGRSSFTPKYDGSDRWLQRIYAHHSLFSAPTEAASEGILVRVSEKKLTANDYRPTQKFLL